MINLTPDKQHSDVVRTVQPLMKDGAALGYSHGFNIVEVGEQIRKDITVVMVAPKCPGTEVREEYKRGFGVPTLIAVHPENDPKGEGMAIAKAWAAATGGHRAGVLAGSRYGVPAVLPLPASDGAGKRHVWPATRAWREQRRGGKTGT